MSEKTLTQGEQAVGIRFNPSGEKAVDEVKQKCAEWIDQIQQAPMPEGVDPYVFNIIKGEAIRTTMDAQMWLTKLITFKP